MAKTASEISALAGELQHVLAERGKRGVPELLRRRILAAVAAHRASGGKAREVIGALGVHEVTVYRWAREMRRKAPRVKSAATAMVPVRVAAAPRRLEMAARPTITTPRGLRVEGLDLDALCIVIARLG